MTNIVEINNRLQISEKKQEEASQQLLASIASMSESLQSFQYQNEMLRKENDELKSGTTGEGLPIQEHSSAIKERMKAKDFMIENLQKEINDLKNKRAETTREMNSIREQINVLKATAKGEKRSPTNETRPPLALTLKFDDFSDSL